MGIFTRQQLGITSACCIFSLVLGMSVISGQRHTHLGGRTVPADPPTDDHGASAVHTHATAHSHDHEHVSGFEHFLSHLFSRAHLHSHTEAVAHDHSDQNSHTHSHAELAISGGRPASHVHVRWFLWDLSFGGHHHTPTEKHRISTESQQDTVELALLGESSFVERIVMVLYFGIGPLPAHQRVALFDAKHRLRYETFLPAGCDPAPPLLPPPEAVSV